MGVDKVAVAIFAEDKIFIGLQPRQNGVAAGFVGDIFADQPYRGLGGFQLANQMVG